MRHPWSVDSITIILHLPVTPDSSFPMLHPSVLLFTNIAIVLILLNLKSILHFSTYKNQFILARSKALSLGFTNQRAPFVCTVSLAWIFCWLTFCMAYCIFACFPQKFHYPLKMTF